MHERIPRDERRWPLSRAGAVALPIGAIAALIVLSKTERDAVLFVGSSVECT